MIRELEDLLLELKERMISIITWKFVSKL